MGDDGKIRVLVADDSAFMRKVLRDLLERDPQIEVAGEARDGRDAVRLSEELRPDVICMDLLMPHMDGLEATEIIMSSNPRPILVVSSVTKDGAEPTVRALELGAIDFVGKPSAGIDLDMATVSAELVRKVKLAAKVHVVRTAAPKMAKEAAPTKPPEPSEPAPLRTSPSQKMPLVVIAASTGGPQTLMQVIPQFPADFSGVVLIVQHMPGDFTGTFSAQLAAVSALRVKEAEPGEMMRAGTAYLCPGAHHMRVSITGRLLLEDSPRVNGYRPCADITMESAASYAGQHTLAVVLTGMGGDAVNGAEAVRKKGGFVIAQDEALSVVFGMNGEVIRRGVADHIVSPDGVYAAVAKRILYLTGAARVGAL